MQDVILTRFRHNCRSLNGDLFRVNIVNNPRCDCGYAVEDARHFLYDWGEREGSVVECRTPEREVGGSKPTAALLCPWARHFTPRKYWLITQEAVAPSRHDWKIVDWDVKPKKQNKKQTKLYDCPLHNDQWNNLNAISFDVTDLNMLLNGNPNLDNNINSSIHESVLKYIKDTHRLT